MVLAGFGVAGLVLPSWWHAPFPPCLSCLLSPTYLSLSIPIIDIDIDYVTSFSWVAVSDIDIPWFWKTGGDGGATR